MDIKEISESDVSAAQLATLIGISVARVNQLVNEGRLVRINSKYKLGESLKTYCAELREQAAGRSASNLDGENTEKLDPVYEGARLKNRQSQIIEMKIKKANAELMSMEEATNVVGRYISSARSKLLGLASSLPTQIHGMNAQDIEVIKNSVYDVLDELADDVSGFKNDMVTEVLESTDD